MLLGIRIAQPSKEITIQLTAFLIAAPEPRLATHDASNLTETWLFMSVPLILYHMSQIAEGERASSCLDPPRSSEGFLTAPPSGEVTPTAPHEQALVSLEAAINQQVHQPIAELLLADSRADSLVGLAGTVPQLSAPDRPNCEAEASQMEMSPASTGGERGGATLDTVREGGSSIKLVWCGFFYCFF